MVTFWNRTAEDVYGWSAREALGRVADELLGTRYPRGPLSWAEHVGLDHVLAIMDGLAAEHGDDRYRAAPLLRKMAAARPKAWPA